MCSLLASLKIACASKTSRKWYWTDAAFPILRTLVTAIHTHTKTGAAQKRDTQATMTTMQKGRDKKNSCRELLWQSFCLIWVFVSLCDSGLFCWLPLQSFAMWRFSCRSVALLPEHMARTKPSSPPLLFPLLPVVHLWSCLRDNAAAGEEEAIRKLSF